MIHDAIHIVKEKSQAPQARLEALLKIVEQFHVDYLPLLEELLQDQDENPDIRSAAALALGKISGQQSFDILKAYASDQDNTVRNYVIQALGMTHLEAAAPLLVTALEDQNNTIFASASEALGELGRKAIPYLIELLSSGAEDARCVAAWQLGELRERGAAHALVETIKRENSVSVIALCIWALGEIGLDSEEVLQILAKAKQEAEPDVRLRAETAFIKISRQSN